VPIRFEMIEKGQDGRHVEMVERDVIGRNLLALVQEVQEESHGIAIRGDRLRTHLFLLEQMVGKEGPH
jgi:hypothetical protein